MKYFINAFVFGIASSLVCLLFFFIQLSLQINPFGASKAFGYLLMFIMFFPGLYYFRRKVLGGEMHFHQGFAFSTLMNLFACVLYVILFGVYIKYFNSELLDKHIFESKTFLRSIKVEYVKSMNLESYEANLKSLDNLSIYDIVWDEFYKRITILMFFVFVASFVMRRTFYSLDSKK